MEETNTEKKKQQKLAPLTDEAHAKLKRLSKSYLKTSKLYLSQLVMSQEEKPVIIEKDEVSV